MLSETIAFISSLALPVKRGQRDGILEKKHTSEIFSLLSYCVSFTDKVLYPVLYLYNMYIIVIFTDCFALCHNMHCGHLNAGIVYYKYLY